MLAARIARNHEQPADTRQRGDDLLYDAIGEVVFLGVAAHVPGTGGWMVCRAAQAWAAVLAQRCPGEPGTLARCAQYS
jgi:hypothetical protein